MFELVPDVLGYLVLNDEGAILSVRFFCYSGNLADNLCGKCVTQKGLVFLQSGGDLENAESTANVFTTIISLTDKLGDDEKYRKLSSK